MPFWQIRGCWFQIWQYFFKLTSQNTQIRHFWSQIWFFVCLFVLYSFLHFGKFLGADSKYHNLFFPSFSLKISKRTFLASNWRIFIFSRNVFKLSTQNYANRAFLVPKLKHFVLHDLPFHKFEGTDSRYKNFF